MNKSALRAELVARARDVIFASGIRRYGRCGKRRTRFRSSSSAVSDPVAAGLVTSLERPGGNITGVSLLCKRRSEQMAGVAQTSSLPETASHYARLNTRT